MIIPALVIPALSNPIAIRRKRRQLSHSPLTLSNINELTSRHAPDPPFIRHAIRLRAAQLGLPSHLRRSSIQSDDHGRRPVAQTDIDHR